MPRTESSCTPKVSKTNKNKAHSNSARARSTNARNIHRQTPSRRKGLFVARSPVRPLLVQHAVAALLAADGIAALQRDLVVAVAAQVVHRALGVFEAAAAGLEAGVGGAGGAEVGLAAGGGGLVLFAGHSCVVVEVLVVVVSVEA